MTSSHHGPYVRGGKRATMVITARRDTARWSKSLKNGPSSDWEAAIRPHEAGIASNRGSATPR
jgi:hypothetical protein